jgi:mRNA-degrading endonuclease RelE of RelBE toxin-antitoxin system
MVARFKIIATSSFSRSLKKLAAKHPDIPEVYEALLNVLQHDPLNLSHRQPIKKLTNIEVGQWRIRAGVYRLRYDVSGDTVVLHSINHRSTAY